MFTVCAIILDYFGSEKTIACLKSLCDQGIDAVMIVDNSGDRRANKQLQEALAIFGQKEMPFKIYRIVNPKNLGYAAGVNKALRWLEENRPHRYYLLMNNDAVAIPGMLSDLLKFMKKNKNTAITAPMIDNGYLKHRGYWYHRFSGLMFSRNIIGTFKYLTGCCLLVDRQIVDDGLFDEDFFMYGEDVALCWRLKFSDRNMACVKNAIVWHEGTGSSHQGGFFYEYHMVRGHLLLVRKLARHQGEIPFLYLGRLLALPARAIVRSIRFRSYVPVAACIKAFKKGP